MEKTTQMEIKTLDKGRRHLRGVFIGDEVVSWLTVIDYYMRIGSAEVKMGALAYVKTKEKHRMKGYMRALVESSVEYMKERGYDVSMVGGIPDFYYKFGYASSLIDHVLTIRTRNAEDAREKDGRYRIRKFRKSDSERVVKIYNANNKQRVCSVIREKEYFSEFPRDNQNIFVVEDDNEDVVAYAVLQRSKSDVRVLELGAKTDNVFGTLLAKFAKTAVKLRAGDIQLFLPPDHPFAEFCHRCDCGSTISYRKNSSFMMRIINQDALFRKLEPEFNRRISRSHLKDYSGSFVFRTDIGVSRFKIDKGSVKVQANRKGKAVLNLSQAQLTQLLVGYRSARDVLKEAGIKAGRNLESLINVLLPKGNPYIWDRSRFENLRMRPEEF